VSEATLVWGQQWPPAPGPNIPPPPGPVTTLRPTSYELQVSGNGSSWQTVATVARTSGTVDVLHFPRVRARFVRVAVLSASGTELPELDELTVTA
jgi:hypothetical protein